MIEKHDGPSPTEMATIQAEATNINKEIDFLVAGGHESPQKALEYLVSPSEIENDIEEFKNIWDGLDPFSRRHTRDHYLEIVETGANHPEVTVPERYEFYKKALSYMDSSDRKIATNEELEKHYKEADKKLDEATSTYDGMKDFLEGTYRDATKMGRAPEIFELIKEFPRSQMNPDQIRALDDFLKAQS